MVEFALTKYSDDMCRWSDATPSMVLRAVT
jgi:hypothetical protein